LFYPHILIDRDECELGLFECDGNAKCVNTDGSYLCTCNSGFKGDGKICYGKISGTSLALFII